MKILTYIFAALGTVLLVANLAEIAAITNASFVLDLADSSGGNSSDIVGGFACIFFFLAFVFGMIAGRKPGQKSLKWVGISSLVLLAVAFFDAWSDVI